MSEDINVLGWITAKYFEYKYHASVLPDFVGGMQLEEKQKE